MTHSSRKKKNNQARGRPIRSDAQPLRLWALERGYVRPYGHDMGDPLEAAELFRLGYVDAAFAKYRNQREQEIVGHE